MQVLGNTQELLCPLADIMRYFRCGFPADDAPSVLAITVGTWPHEKQNVVNPNNKTRSAWPYPGQPLTTTAEIELAVCTEAGAAGYSLTLLRRWDYRLVTLLYRVEKIDELADSVLIREQTEV